MLNMCGILRQIMHTTHKAGMRTVDLIVDYGVVIIIHIWQYKV